MNIAICDNSRQDAFKLCSCLKRYGLQNAVSIDIFLFPNTDSLLQSWHTHSYQILFIDSHSLPNRNQPENQICFKGDPECIHIITFDSRCRACEFFSPDAFGYLCKPFTLENVSLLMKRLEKLFPLEFKTLEIMVNRLLLHPALKYIFYIEVFGRTCTVYLFKDGIETSYRTNTPLYKIERQLDSTCFLKANKSFIVNINHITEINDSCFCMANKKRIPINVKNRLKLKQQFLNYHQQTLQLPPCIDIQKTETYKI